MAEDPTTETTKTTTETTVNGGHKTKGIRRWRYGGMSNFYGKDKGGYTGNMWRSISQFIVILLLLLAFTAFILWLVYRPSDPKFSLISAAVYDLNTSTPPFISTTMQFTIVSRNPSNRASIYYDRLRAFVMYKNQKITPPLMLPPLHQHKDSTVAMSPVLGGVGVPTKLGVGNMILTDMESFGLVQLRLVVQGRLKWKTGGIKTSNQDLYVTCDMLIGLKKGVFGQVPLLGSSRGHDHDQEHHNCNVDV